jgi:polysaccharide biosynthesis protein PslJ
MSAVAGPRSIQAQLPDTRRDATSVLTVFVVLLVAVPSRLVFQPLGAAGTPAEMLALLAFLWWASARLVPSLGPATGAQPVRSATFLLGGAILASYAAAFTRVIEPGEIRAADRGLLSLAAWAGICLLAADGVDRAERLEALLGRVVAAAAGLACVGILQFFTGFDLAGYLHVPGLTLNQPLVLIDQRSIFRRVAGTATHPIEFGVVLALVLPVALHFAFGRDRRRPELWPCLAVAAIAVAIPMSLSRSALLGLPLGMLVLFAAWPARRRLAALIVTPVVLVGMRLMVPGMLGTIRSLFVNLRSDPSFQGRTDDYAVVGKFIAAAPVFGRGFGTFDPRRYVLLDNQYLGSLIETGLVGLVALLGVFLAALACARGARLRLADPDLRGLAQALAASVVVATVSFATFDALAFPMATCMVFLLLGCCGALWRLSRDEAVAR